jgi:hypothetical protein
MSALTTVTKATTGVIKGDIVLTDADIAELQKGSFYVEMATENAADGVRAAGSSPGCSSSEMKAVRHRREA